MSLEASYWLARESGRTLRVLRQGPDEIRALASRRLRQTLAAAANARHVQRRLSDAGVDHGLLTRGDPDAVLRDLPPVDKQSLREAGDDALVGGRARRGWFSSVSSGSTGEPFRTWFDARAWAILKYLVKVRSRLANGMHPYDRVAILDAIPVEAEGTTLLERAGRVRRISVFRSGPELAAELASFRPRAIYGLATALLEAGDAMEAVGSPVHVPLLFTSGEVLLPSTRRALEGAFGARVLDIYGSTELKEVAWECAAGGMHLNADVALLEVLGAHGERVPAGVEGEIVVTSLVNVAMPLIRFRIGDRGILSDERCPCGVALPLFGVVTGREAEMLHLGGKRLSPYVLTSALEQVKGLVRYQVRQVEPSKLAVRGRLASGADPAAVIAGIRSVIARAISYPLSVDVQIVERMEQGPGRKTRVVEPLAAQRQDDER